MKYERRSSIPFKMTLVLDKDTFQTPKVIVAKWMRSIGILLLLLLYCCLCFFSITCSCESILSQEGKNTFNQLSSNWTIKDVLDDFDDPTGEQYLECIVSGYYSNINIQEGELSVIIKYFPNDYTFGFQFLENQETKAIFDEKTAVLLKIKIDDVVHEYNLLIEAPYDSICLSAKSQWEEFDEIRNWLLSEKNLRCVVVIEDVKYHFSIPAEGFAETLIQETEEELADVDYNHSKYELALNLMKIGDYETAKAYFIELGDYLDARRNAALCYEKIRKQENQTENDFSLIQETEEELADVDHFMVFDANGTLRYDARVVDGQVEDGSGNLIPGCFVNDDGFVVDSYWNVINPKTGTLVDTLF